MFIYLRMFACIHVCIVCNCNHLRLSMWLNKETWWWWWWGAPGVEWQSTTRVAARWRRRGTEHRYHQSSSRQHVVLVWHSLTCRLNGSLLRWCSWREQTRVRTYSHCQRVRQDWAGLQRRRRTLQSSISCKQHGRPQDFFQGWAMRGLKDGGPQAGSRPRAPVGVWGQSPQKRTIFSKNNAFASLKALYNISGGGGGTRRKSPLAHACGRPWSAIHYWLKRWQLRRVATRGRLDLVPFHNFYHKFAHLFGS